MISTESSLTGSSTGLQVRSEWALCSLLLASVLLEYDNLSELEGYFDAPARGLEGFGTEDFPALAEYLHSSLCLRDLS